jgi:hypothetical protein
METTEELLLALDVSMEKPRSVHMVSFSGHFGGRIDVMLENYHK